MNGTMLQAFEWYTPADQKHWQNLKDKVPELAKVGFTAFWIPPPTKGSSKDDNGYGIYDLWDLGEFDQKGTRATKWGPKEDLLDMVKVAKEHKIGIYADVVLNHKAAADETEKFKVKEVNPDNREEVVSEEKEIKAWTGFTFPGRGDKYSDFKWHWYHFTGTDWDEGRKQTAIYEIQGFMKGWADDVDDENGNYDYLMYADIDYSHPEVVEETRKWALWVVKELSLSGFRLDAVKHIPAHFIADLIKYVREETKNDRFFAVGEFWKDSLDSMSRFLEENNYSITLFDVCLHYNFVTASQAKREYDMRQIYDGSLVQKYPLVAVTLVDNHDTQPKQALESFVGDWFKPLAYALILTRAEGYPCIFYGDYYGIADPPIEGKKDLYLEKLVQVRSKFAYGEQNDYFDHANCIAWVRRDDPAGEHPDACAVIMSNGDDGSKHVFFGEEHGGQVLVDVLGWWKDEVTIDEGGWADIFCHGESMSVWIRKGALKE